MNIGNRLRMLREAKGLSQGDIEARTGLLRPYISRVENGHTIPTLENIEKLAKAFELELYQLFYAGDGKPVAPRVREVLPLNSLEESLLTRFRALRSLDQQLMLGLAGQLVRRRRKG